MNNNEIVDSEIKKLKKYINDIYKLDLNYLGNYRLFAEVLLKSILCSKVWKEKLSVSGLKDNQSLIYHEEIISNFHQVVLLGILGFKSASFSMLRKILENMFKIIYYKDHPVEFFKKELLIGEKKSLTIEDFKDYIKKYPHQKDIKIIENEILVKLKTQVLSDWTDLYRELSNYVHGTNSNYLDLANYLDDIKPNNDLLSEITQFTKKIISILNIFYLLFFFKNYTSEFEEIEKSLIRFTIYTKGYKKAATEALGEI